MQKLERVLTYAEQQCKASGARLTTKRKQVLSGLVHADKALSAYELADYCKAHFNVTLPPMSVYRILDFLQSEQLVHRLNTENKFVACSHITCEHTHGVPQFLICEQCQAVKEIVIETRLIDELKQNIDQAGFHLSSDQLEMRCLCEKCHVKAA